MKLLLGILLAIVCLLLPAGTIADTWLSATVASYHTDRDADYNERNWGLGVEHGVAPGTRLVAGVYRNSFYRESVYAGATWMPLRWGSFAVGFAGVLVTGYDDPVAPAVLPALTFERRNWGINLGLMPQRDVKGVEMIGLQVKVRLQ